MRRSTSGFLRTIPSLRSHRPVRPGAVLTVPAAHGSVVLVARYCSWVVGTRGLVLLVGRCCSWPVTARGSLLFMARYCSPFASSRPLLLLAAPLYAFAAATFRSAVHAPSGLEIAGHPSPVGDSSSSSRPPITLRTPANTPVQAPHSPQSIAPQSSDSLHRGHCSPDVGSKSYPQVGQFISVSPRLSGRRRRPPSTTRPTSGGRFSGRALSRS